MFATLKLGFDLPTSVNERVIWPFQDTLFSRNAKFPEDKTLTKCQNLKYLNTGYSRYIMSNFIVVLLIRKKTIL